MRAEMAHALPMRALDALLSVEHDGDPFAVIFESLRDVFAFDQALVLEEDEDAVHCVAALPQALAGLHWRPGPFFKDIASGRVAALCGDRDMEEWQDVATDLISAAQPALYLPI
jgi:hypothetical protein